MLVYFSLSYLHLAKTHFERGVEDSCTSSHVERDLFINFLTTISASALAVALLFALF